MSIGEVRLRSGEEKDLRAGGCWVYDNEISMMDRFGLEEYLHIYLSEWV